MRELIHFHSRGVVLETILDAKASYGTEKETDRQKKKAEVDKWMQAAWRWNVVSKVASTGQRTFRWTSRGLIHPESPRSRTLLPPLLPPPLLFLFIFYQNGPICPGTWHVITWISHSYIENKVSYHSALFFFLLILQGIAAITVTSRAMAQLPAVFGRVCTYVCLYVDLSLNWKRQFRRWSLSDRISKTLPNVSEIFLSGAITASAMALVLQLTPVKHSEYIVSKSPYTSSLTSRIAVT